MMPDIQEIQRAARLLEQGKLVAFPTETVYGLGADASNPEAIAAIFTAKGRPSNHPIIVHVAHNADLTRWASAIPAEAHLLINAFWPGPLTLILPRADNVPAAVVGGQNSIGLRCPSHPVARALLAEFRHGQGGIAAHLYWNQREKTLATFQGPWIKSGDKYQVDADVTMYMQAAAMTCSR